MNGSAASTQVTPNLNQECRPGLSRNRSAFLLGLGLAEPALDDLREHLFHLSDLLPTSKVLLLDAAVARMELYTCQRAGMHGLCLMSTEIGNLAKSYSVTWSFLFDRELDYVQRLIGHLVQNTREIHPWFSAGLCAGQLLKKYSPHNSQQLDLRQPPEMERFRDSLRTAANHRTGRIGSNEALLTMCDQFVHPPSIVSLRNDLMRLAEVIEDPVPNPTDEKLERRNDLIYDQLSKGIYGQRAVQIISTACEANGWECPGSWEQIKRVADEVALEKGFPSLPSRPPGRPPKKNKSQNNSG